MPTPFTHLVKAEQFIVDQRVPHAVREFLRENWAAFLLGNIAPDSHHRAPDSAINRASTHFFNYGTPPATPPDKILLKEYPLLHRNALQQSEHIAFMAGYLGHLAVDVVWAQEVVNVFFSANWGDRKLRHFAFTALIALIDQRDYERIPTEHHQLLRQVTPQRWLSFLPDAALQAWRDMVADQLSPDGSPQTLKILGRTVYSSYDDLYDMVHSEQRQQQELWQNFSQQQVAEAETHAYENMRRVICDYLDTEQ